jgi:hypothetical protein
MEAGMSEGPVFAGWQHCRGELTVRHMLAVNVV